jgi:hypothetical protein
MISKSTLGGAIAILAATGLASSAFAQMRADAIGKGPIADPSSLHAFSLVACYAPSCTGGGSAGYNYHVAHDYRLKQHHAHARDHNLPGATK